MSEKIDVLVIGAGPTGLTMAVQLVRYGLSCRIIDTTSGVTDKSKALVVHSRTMEIFEEMGIIQAALEKGVHCSGGSLYVQGERIIHITLNDLDTPYPFFLDLNQSDTETILYNRLQSLWNDVEWETEVIKLVQAEDKVEATIKKNNGDQETITASYVCACDGARSFCRHALNLDFPGDSPPQEFLLADVELDWHHTRDEFYGYLTDRGLFFAAPLAQNNRWRVITESPRQDTSDREAVPTMEELQNAVNETAPVNTTISNPVWLSYFRVHHRLLNRFREGRIFFAGDAAHIHSPIGGQGMNTGIQDAYNLAWKLSFVLKGVAKPELLDSYNIERHTVAKELVMGTDQIFRTLMLRHPLSQTIRNQVAAFLSSLEVIQHRVQKRMAMLSIGYRESPISMEHRAGIFQSQKPGDAVSGVLRWHDFGAAPNAGDRAIDAFLDDCRLFDILDGLNFHLLLFAGSNHKEDIYSNFSQIVKAIRGKYSSYIIPHIVIYSSENYTSEKVFASYALLDPEADCHHRYGARSDCLYLIRPDGYVGFRSQPADLNRLLDYCNQFLVS